MLLLSFEPLFTLLYGVLLIVYQDFLPNFDSEGIIGIFIFVSFPSLF